MLLVLLMDDCDAELREPGMLQKPMLVKGDQSVSSATSEKNAGVIVRKPRPRDIISKGGSSISQNRGLNANTLKRPSSACASRKSLEPSTSQPKRAISAERRPSSPVRSCGSSSPLATPSSISLGSISRSATPVNEAASQLRNASRRPSSDAASGLWPSMRNLSTSFQGESTKERSLNVQPKKEKSPNHFSDLVKARNNTAEDRKRSPLKGKNTSAQLENSQSSAVAAAKVDQRRWPAMIGGRTSTEAMARSIDLSRKALNSSSSFALSRGISPNRLSTLANRNAMSRSVDLTDMKKSSPSSAPSRAKSPRKATPSVGNDATTNGVGISSSKANSIPSSVRSHETSLSRKLASDVALTKSVDLADRGSKLTASFLARGISPRRFMARSGSDAMSRSVDLGENSVAVQPQDILPNHSQDYDMKGNGPSHLQCMQESPMSTETSCLEEQKVHIGKGVLAGGTEATHLKRLTRTLTTQNGGLLRPSSPSMCVSTLLSSKRLQSPLRARPSSPISISRSSTSSSDGASSVINYMIDVSKSKKSANHTEEAHQLRLLYNRILQWRLVNAFADETQAIQRMDSETGLYSVCNATWMLLDSVILKRLDLQQLRQEAKLLSVLKNQIEYLDQWMALETEHQIYLSGAVEALRGSTLRLPVSPGTKADISTMKNAISSAVEVMQTMASSIAYLLSKLQSANSLVAEIAGIALKERAMLDECRELLVTAALLQVQDCSLRTQLMQRRQRLETLI